LAEVAIPLADADVPGLDLFDPGFLADPFTRLAELARDHPLARTPFGIVVLRYDDCQAVLRDPRLHQGIGLVQRMQGITDEQFLARSGRSILSTEGDEHTRLRKLVSRAFTPRATDRLRPFMRQVVDRLVDDISPAGRADFVAAVSDPYPIPIICALLGAPEADLPLFSRWATEILKSLGLNLAHDLPAVLSAQDEMDRYVEALIERRRDEPGDDLLTDLIAAEEAGDRLSHEELVMMAEAVLLGGTDTTRNQLATGIWLFAHHPEQWAMLAARPDLAPSATDEVLRVHGVVRSTVRVATTDVDVAGVTIPSGTLVAPSFSAANRDPAHFTDPMVFDITRRADRPHLGFGGGIHYCLGASLARAELAEAFAVLARRLPGLALDGEPAWRSPLGIQGPTSLPIRFDPGH
jgi:cytochrome P450